MGEKDKIKINVRIPINLETFKKIQKELGVSYEDLLKLFITEGINKYAMRTMP